MSARPDIPYAFEYGVYQQHGEAITAAVHEVFPNDEHDGRLCDEICNSVGRLVVGLLYDATTPTTNPAAAATRAELTAEQED